MRMLKGMSSSNWQSSAQFQSAPPVRGATIGHGRRDALGKVSIRAPREGSDSPESASPPAVRRSFQSAPPVRGATDGKVVPKITVHVSIRAPREGSDLCN